MMQGAQHRRRPPNVLIVWLGCLVIAASTAQADRVERRGSNPPLTGTIQSMDDNGVTVLSSTGAKQTVTWDRIRDVVTEDPSLKTESQRYREDALSLWRARSRLERGDYSLAEPLFERLFAQYRGRTHETALIVAEGLLRCRLHRAANDVAVVPSLEVARLRRKGIVTTSYDALSPLMDDSTALCMRLPPFWIPSGSLARVEADLNSYDAQGDTAVAAMAGWYRAAARRALEMPAITPPRLAEDDPGVTLLRELVACIDSDAEVRARSRDALATRLSSMPTWSQAWVRYAIGTSLLMESGIGRQEAGLVSLAHVPADALRDQPYLSAMSLAHMCLVLHQLGQVDAAATLKADLLRDFPNHPALLLVERISARPSSPPQSAKPPAARAPASPADAPAPTTAPATQPQPRSPFPWKHPVKQEPPITFAPSSVKDTTCQWV